MKVFVRARYESDIPQVTMLHTRTEPIVSEEVGHVVIADLPEDTIRDLQKSEHFEVYEDIEFRPAILPQPTIDWWARQLGQPPPPPSTPWFNLSQADVMRHIRADAAWNIGRGAGVTIAVVDTGIDGAMPEFQQRSPQSYAPSFSTPWNDTIGHGSMCAAIACGSNQNGGRYNGVAPDATLLSARTDLHASDLYLIYQHLLREKRQGSFNKGLVVSNSYAHYMCDPPTYAQGHPYVDLVKKCVQEGIVFIFSAGNNHSFGLCQHSEVDDHPNTIWSINSIDEVLTVGTVDWNESNQRSGSEHANSSRGGGQWSTRGDKPDGAQIAVGGGRA
jgi:serine protease AprX